MDSIDDQQLEEARGFGEKLILRLRIALHVTIPYSPWTMDSRCFS